MKTYGWHDRLPDLPTNPRDPSHECNDCGHLFDGPSLGTRDPDDYPITCPKCNSKDVHRT